VKASATGRAAIPGLVDRVSEEARRALRERESDLAAARAPVAESLTPSLEAYRHYFEARQLDDSQFDAERALAAYRRALKADPGFALPHLEIAIMAGWHEAPEEDPAWHLAEAARHAQRLPEKERKVVLAWKARQEGRYPEARALFEELSSAYPDDKEVLYLAGETLWHGGTPDGPAEAVRYFRRALDLDPDYLVAMVHLLQWIAVLGEPDEALVRARRAAALAPGPMTLAMLARAQAYSGDAEAALAGARRAVELAGGSHFESSYVLAEVLLWAGRQAEAEAELQRWLAPAASPGQRRVTLEFLPIALAAGGRRREALRAFEGLTGTGCARRCDTFDETLKLHVLLVGGDRRAAREELARWEPPDELEVQPHLWLWPWLGLAEAGSRRAAGLVPGSLWERRFAGAAALGRGDHAAAVEILSALARRDPAVETHFLLAEALLGAGRPRDALAPLARVTDTFPLYAPRWQAALRPWALFLRARTHAQLGELGPARVQLERLRAEWRRADPGLPLAGEVRALARELGR
jgi:tetratricopeptide (TPR) repeat protein